MCMCGSEAMSIVLSIATYRTRPGDLKTILVGDSLKQNELLPMFHWSAALFLLGFQVD